MPGQSGGLRDHQLRTERNGDLAGYLVLQGEQIAHVAVEPLGPQMRVGLGIDQPGVDTDLVASPPNASFQHIAHAELAADLFASIALPLYVNAAPRAITKLPEIRERSVVRPSVRPSAKYSWSGSLLRLVKGSTTIDSGGGRCRSRQ